MNLIDLVIEELKDNFSYNDYTVLKEVLEGVPENSLVKVLSEESQKIYLEESSIKKEPWKPINEVIIIKLIQRKNEVVFKDITANQMVEEINNKTEIANEFINRVLDISINLINQ